MLKALLDIFGDEELEDDEESESDEGEIVETPPVIPSRLPVISAPGHAGSADSHRTPRPWSSELQEEDEVRHIVGVGGATGVVQEDDPDGEKVIGVSYGGRPRRRKAKQNQQQHHSQRDVLFGGKQSVQRHLRVGSRMEMIYHLLREENESAGELKIPMGVDRMHRSPEDGSGVLLGRSYGEEGGEWRNDFDKV